jgi:hypothetical protein
MMAEDAGQLDQARQLYATAAAALPTAGAIQENVARTERATTPTPAATPTPK